ncbi:hypothetical protein HYH03_013098 [Edaphochlamys debaryana]|uniref:XPA C-terminal domain-containing protein n=1 Tax=Edaphochlamys debaryana TaxID=47281 RepID=A0A835XRH7_9CHLO|nr:hypothetical protein HYH03_013098 [Edaphochlamys debaryana]|eukprot:KAG2488414.1 hypothetical protein HYH03_013098 [Edaphochlamys debaryana]
MDGGGFFCAGGTACEHCGSLSFSNEWYQAFGVLLCNQCKRDEALISKGHALTLYSLTAKDLNDLGCLTKTNPQHKSWTPMRLYLKRQVEDVARRKHGDLELAKQLRHDKAQAKAERWLAKRAREPGLGAEDPEEGEEGEQEGPGGDAGGGERVALSAAAARVRARLASEYEGQTSAQRPASEGRDTGPAAEPDVEAEVEEF